METLLQLNLYSKCTDVNYINIFIFFFQSVGDVSLESRQLLSADNRRLASPEEKLSTQNGNVSPGATGIYSPLSSPSPNLNPSLSMSSEHTSPTAQQAQVLFICCMYASVGVIVTICFRFQKHC